jgi:hypothetical protein
VPEREPMSMRRLVILAFLVGSVALASASAASAGTIEYRNVIGPKGTAQVAVRVFRPAAFHLLLRTSTHGRTRLYLEGKTAPGGGPLIDTQTYACEGAAGSFYCEGAFEALPPGIYTFRVEYRGTTPERTGIELTIRW